MSFVREDLALQIQIVGSIKTIDQSIKSSVLHDAMTRGVNFRLELDKAFAGDLGTPRYFRLSPMYNANARTNSPYVFNIINILFKNIDFFKKWMVGRK